MAWEQHDLINPLFATMSSTGKTLYRSEMQSHYFDYIELFPLFRHLLIYV